MMVPRLILGIALLGFYNLVAIDLSLVTVIFGPRSFAMPYVVLIVSARLVGFDRIPRGSGARSRGGDAPRDSSGRSRCLCWRRRSSPAR